MKKRFSFIFGLTLFILMFFVLRNINFGEVVGLLKEISLVWFGLAFLAFCFSFLLWNLRRCRFLMGLGFRS